MFAMTPLETSLRVRSRRTSDQITITIVFISQLSVVTGILKPFLPENINKGNSHQIRQTQI